MAASRRDMWIARPLEDHSQLRAFSKRRLYARAARLGIRGRSRMTKAELARAIELRGERLPRDLR
jgi:hypothetical protein